MINISAAGIILSIATLTLISCARFKEAPLTHPLNFGAWFKTATTPSKAAPQRKARALAIQLVSQK